MQGNNSYSEIILKYLRYFDIKIREGSYEKVDNFNIIFCLSRVWANWLATGKCQECWDGECFGCTCR